MSVNAWAAKEKGGKLEPYAFDFPDALGDQHVEIEVEYCGLCHSDISIIDDEWMMFPEYPVVAGHEIVGRVAAVGKEVTSLTVGQRVGMGWNSGYCNACKICASGNQNMCKAQEVTAVGRTGGFAERVRGQAAAVVPIPESLPPNVSGPLLCAGSTIFTPLVLYGIKPTDKVGVLGMGGLGHIAVQFYVAWGCDVTVFTSSSDKRDAALKMGARRAVSSTDFKEIAAIDDLDFLVSTVGANLKWDAFLNTLNINGRLHFVGIFTDQVSFSQVNILDTQRSISGSPVASPANMKLMLNFAARHKLYPQVEEFPMEKINDAIQKVKDNTVRFRAVLKVKRG